MPAEAPAPAPQAAAAPEQAQGGTPEESAEQAPTEDKTTEQPAALAAKPAEAPRAEAPAAPPPAARSVIEQITQYAAVTKSEGVTTLELQLQPAELGKLSIIMEQASDGLRAVIRPQNDSVRGLIAAHTEELLRGLRDMGLNMKDVTVSQPTVAWDFTRGDFSRQNADGGRFAGREGGRPLSPASAPVNAGVLQEAAPGRYYRYEEDTAFEMLA
jgi:flagellar hook-length control protein FliK